MMFALRWCLLVAMTLALSQDAQEPKSGLNDLQYPDDSLMNNEGDMYSMTPGLVPPPRVKGTITYSDSLVVVMGGYDTEGKCLDDIHIYDTNIRKWSGVLLKRACCNYEGEVIERMGATEASSNQPGIELNLPMARSGFEGDLPVARAEHASCSINSMIYVFGGYSSNYELMNDFYSFNPKEIQWELIDRYGGQAPTRRAGHSLITDYHNRNIVLFGGRASISGRIVGLSDVHIYDLNSKKWELATSNSDNDSNGNMAPIGRQHSACAIARSTLFVVGGIDPASHMIYNDVWSFDLTGTKKWKMIASNTGQMHGFAPPPLYHSTLIAVNSKKSETPVNVNNMNTNSTGHEHYDLILYGGVGSGGSCGSATCGQKETSLGQVYRLPVNFDQYELDNSNSVLNQAPELQVNMNSELNSIGISGVSIDGNNFNTDIKTWRLRLEGSGWKYARISDNSDDSVPHGHPNTFGVSGASGPGGGGAFGRGRRLKTYGMEIVTFDSDRKLMYELGGMQTIPLELTKASQAARELAGPILLDTGNDYTGNGRSTGVADSGSKESNSGNQKDAPLWDIHTQEHLRTTTQLPVNGPWVFEDGFERFQPQINNTLRFLQTFRTFTISESKNKNKNGDSAMENVILSIEDKQGTVP
jgi:hypothetical protein